MRGGNQGWQTFGMHTEMEGGDNYDKNNWGRGFSQTVEGMILKDSPAFSPYFRHFRSPPTHSSSGKWRLLRLWKISLQLPGCQNKTSSSSVCDWQACLISVEHGDWSQLWKRKERTSYFSALLCFHDLFQRKGTEKHV